MFCKTNAQTEYRYWFSRNGVDIYERWSCSGCSDLHIKLKIVNTNGYKVTVSWDKFKWLNNGAVVKEESGQMDDFGPGVEKSGDYQGLWFYPPDGYNAGTLHFQMDNFKVVNANNNISSPAGETILLPAAAATNKLYQYEKAY